MVSEIEQHVHVKVQEVEINVKYFTTKQKVLLKTAQQICK